MKIDNYHGKYVIKYREEYITLYSNLSNLQTRELGEVTRIYDYRYTAINYAKRVSKSFDIALEVLDLESEYVKVIRPALISLKTPDYQTRVSPAIAGASKRRNVTFNAETASLLDLIEGLTGVNQSEIIRRAIATEAFILKEQAKGSVLQVKRENGEICEIFLR